MALKVYLIHGIHLVLHILCSGIQCPFLISPSSASHFKWSCSPMALLSCVTTSSWTKAPPAAPSHPLSLDLCGARCRDGFCSIRRPVTLLFGLSMNKVWDAHISVPMPQPMNKVCVEWMKRPWKWVLWPSWTKEVKSAGAAGLRVPCLLPKKWQIVDEWKK